MHYTRYLSYVADWHAYPQEIQSPELQALVILRNGLPIQIRQYVPMPMLGMSVGHMVEDILGAEAIIHEMHAPEMAEGHQAPVDDAGLGEPIFEAVPAFPEDPIPAVPVQEVPHQDAEDEIEADDFDPDDIIVAPEDDPEDPPIIDISSDDEDDLEPELEHAGWLEDDEDFDDDPEEILFADGEEESDSDA